MAVKVVTVKRTYRFQLAVLKGMIRKHSRSHRQFREYLAAEMALPPQERGYHRITELKNAIRRAREIALHAVYQYRNLVKFNRYCDERKIERKIERARAAIADWAANGLPTGEKHD